MEASTSAAPAEAGSVAPAGSAFASGSTAAAPAVSAFSSTAAAPPAAPSTGLEQPKEGDERSIHSSPTTRLYNEALAHLSRRQMLSTLLDSECTFAPKINKGRPSTAGPRSAEKTEGPAFERLYQESAEKQRKLKEKLDEQHARLSFRPELTKKALALKASDKGPIHESLYQKAQELRKKLQERQEAAAREHDFKPHLTKKAKEMKRPGTAADRLYDPDWVRARRAEERNNYDARIASEFQFRPQVNPNPAGLSSTTGDSSTAATSPEKADASTAAAVSGDPGNPNTHTSPRGGAGGSATKGGDKAVFERLYGVGKQHQEAHAAAVEQSRAEEMAKCTFRPDTAKSKASAKKLLGISVVHTGEGGVADAALSAVGAGASPAGSSGAKAGGAGAVSDAHSRLYLHALERAERLRQAALLAQKAEEEECSFKPHISEGSRRIADGATGSSGETGSGTEGGSGAAAATGSAEKAHSHAHHIPRHLLLYEDGLQRQQARLANEVNREGRVNEDDLINCTFQPQLNKNLRQVLSPSAHPHQQSMGFAPSRDDHSTGGSGSSSVHDRLFENAKARQAALQAANSVHHGGLGPSELSHAVIEAVKGSSSGSSSSRSGSARKPGSAGKGAGGSNSGRKNNASSSPTNGSTLSAALAAVSPPSLPPFVNSSNVATVDLRQQQPNAVADGASSSGGKPTQSPLVDVNGTADANANASTDGGRLLFPVSAPTSPFTVPNVNGDSGSGGASSAPTQA